MAELTKSIDCPEVQLSMTCYRVSSYLCITSLWTFWVFLPHGQSSDTNDDRGWTRNRGDDSGHRLVRLRRASATAEEGVFTCHIPEDGHLLSQ